MVTVTVSVWAWVWAWIVIRVILLSGGLALWMFGGLMLCRVLWVILNGGIFGLVCRVRGSRVLMFGVIRVLEAICILLVNAC